MNDSTESNRQLSSSVHGPGCKSDPSSSRIAAVRRLFNDGGVEVILFFFSALQSSVLWVTLIPHLFFTVETWTEDRARFTIGVAGTFCSPLTTYIYARGLTCFPSFSPAFSTPAWQFLGILTTIVAVAALALITMEWFCPIKSTSKKNERISRFLFFFCKRTNKIWLWDLSDLTSRETTLKILNFIDVLFVEKKKSEFVDRVVTL